MTCKFYAKTKKKTKKKPIIIVTTKTTDINEKKYSVIVSFEFRLIAKACSENDGIVMNNNLWYERLNHDSTKKNGVLIRSHARSLSFALNQMH